jgi:hypothetical protein
MLLVRDAYFVLACSPQTKHNRQPKGADLKPTRAGRLKLCISLQRKATRSVQVNIEELRACIRQFRTKNVANCVL